MRRLQSPSYRFILQYFEECRHENKTSSSVLPTASEGTGQLSAEAREEMLEVGTSVSVIRGVSKDLRNVLIEENCTHAVSLAHRFHAANHRGVDASFQYLRILVALSVILAFSSVGSPLKSFSARNHVVHSEIIGLLKVECMIDRCTSLPFPSLPGPRFHPTRLRRRQTLRRNHPQPRPEHPHTRAFHPAHQQPAQPRSDAPSVATCPLAVRQGERGDGVTRDVSDDVLGAPAALVGVAGGAHQLGGAGAGLARERAGV